MFFSPSNIKCEFKYNSYYFKISLILENYIILSSSSKKNIIFILHATCKISSNRSILILHMHITLNFIPLHYYLTLCKYIVLYLHFRIMAIVDDIDIVEGRQVLEKKKAPKYSEIKMKCLKNFILVTAHYIVAIIVHNTFYSCEV